MLEITVLVLIENMLNNFIENSTFPVCLGPQEGKRNDKTKPRYIISFDIKPKAGKTWSVFKGRGLRYKDIHHVDVVVKAMKHYTALPEDWETYLLCNKTARKMALSFNVLTKQKIHFVALGKTTVDERATLTKVHKKFAKEETVVVEERLHGEFINFVSNRSVSLPNDMDILVLEAFCHFTYKQSRGCLVVCGLKGVRKTNTNEFTLTNPTIHSKEGRYGSKDKRYGGIQDFFDNHKCNCFCELLRLSSDTEEGSDEC